MAGYEDSVKSWIGSVTGKPLSGSLEQELKSGVVLCNLVNAIRPNTILNINNYNGAFKQMQNIDNYLKVVEKLGVTDSFKAEDLYYGNNIPKVIVNLVAFSKVASEKFGTPGAISADLDSLRSEAASSQKEGKVRDPDAGLSIFEANQRKAQREASSAARTKDRMIHENQKAVPTSELGFVESEMSGKQKMISSAKSSGQDLIIRSKDQAVASSELGYIESEMTGKQKMISSAKSSGQDLIIRSKDQAVASSELGFIESEMTDKQKMISAAKSSGQDLIIRSKDQAVASSELGFIDSNLTEKQTMISDAKARQMDNIIRSKDKAVGSDELGFIDADLVNKQEMISNAKSEKLDKIIKHSKDEQGQQDVNLDD